MPFDRTTRRAALLLAGGLTVALPLPPPPHLSPTRHIPVENR